MGADRVVHVEHIWGTAITIILPGTAGRENAASAALQRCRAWFAEVDAVFSIHRPLTEAALYRAGLDPGGRRSTDFDVVLAACQALREATGGAFDPWAVPGGYDPSGYVKGWGVGRASRLLAEAGFADHVVNAGGDLYAGGDEESGSGLGWPAGILNPQAPSEVVEVVSLRDLAMATSGRYERGDHVVDPARRQPATGVDSATAVGPDPGVADAVATAALVDGLASMRWFEALGPQWSLHLVIGGRAHTYGPAFEAKPG